MKRLFALLSLLVLSMALPPRAAAAPTTDVAYERYIALLTENRMDSDHQGFLFETLDGETLLAHNVDCPFNPASVVKLATTSTALDRLGNEYRFATAFYTDGGLDRETATLVGNLVVLGTGDPSLTIESLFYVAKELRGLGIERIQGNLVVKGPFYCNYSMDREAAGIALQNCLDVERWNPSIEAAFGRYRLQSGETVFESVTLEGSVVSAPDSSTVGLTPLFTLRSMPLIRVLKNLNNFSNNWMAHIVGGRIGGVTAVKDYVGERLMIPAGEFYLQTTSGLGRNGMRPRDIVVMLRDLDTRLHKGRFSPAAVMPVAGIDPGTLEDRFLYPPYRGAVVAKTGTLRGVSALAGYMYTRSRGVVLFAIMNEGGSPVRFRNLQDSLVTEMFEACGGPAPLPYQKPPLYSDTAGVLIERANGSIPAATRVEPAVTN